ncbi:MAG: phosphate-starvation-inducible PsiE family protein [Streptosporangiaceae bacterium]
MPVDDRDSGSDVSRPNPVPARPPAGPDPSADRPPHTPDLGSGAPDDVSAGDTDGVSAGDTDGVSAGVSGDGVSARRGARDRVRRAVLTPTWMLEHAQDLVTLTVGVVLILLACTLLVAGIVDFARHASGSVTDAAKNLVDVVLLVLILVEIVHTVVLSLRSHRLLAQPFLVIGLVAVIRRILFVLSTPRPAGTSELALLLGMVMAFVVSLITVSRFENRGHADES